MENCPWLFLKRCNEEKEVRVKKKNSSSWKFLLNVMPLFARLLKFILYILKDNILEMYFPESESPVIVISQAASRLAQLGSLVICQ